MGKKSKSKGRRKGQSQDWALTKRSRQSLEIHRERQLAKQNPDALTRQKAEQFEQRLPASTPEQRDEMVRRCLSQRPSPHTKHLILSILAHVKPAERRRLIGKIKQPHQAFALSLLAERWADADPFERFAIIGAAARVAHVAAEPLLLSALDDPNTLIVIAALNALEPIATPAALKPLRTLAAGSHTEIAQRATQVILAIEDRYDLALQASVGALSVAQDSADGALSLVQSLEPGQLALYKRAQEALQAAPEQPKALFKLRPHSWSGLQRAERPLPWPAKLWLFSCAGYWQRELLFAAAVLATIGALGQWLGVLAVCALALIVVIWLGTSYDRRTLEVLQRGVPTLAELTQRIVHDDAHGEQNSHLYTFQYMDARGQLHRVKRAFARRQPQLEDDQLEGMLYLEGDKGTPVQAVLEDELPLLIAGDGGQWGLRKRYVAYLISMWTLAIGALVVGLLRVFL